MYYTIENIKKMNSQVLLKEEERTKIAIKNCLNDSYFGSSLSLMLLNDNVDNLVKIVSVRRRRGLKPLSDPMTIEGGRKVICTVSKT